MNDEQRRMGGFGTHSSKYISMGRWPKHVSAFPQSGAAVFGFDGIAAGAAGIARILFVIFIILFIAFLIINLARGRGP